MKSSTTYPLPKRLPIKFPITNALPQRWIPWTVSIHESSTVDPHTQDQQVTECKRPQETILTLESGLHVFRDFLRNNEEGLCVYCAAAQYALSNRIVLIPQRIVLHGCVM